MKKKNNFINSAYLLNKTSTNATDLNKLANALGFNIDYIGFAYNFPLIKDSKKLCILNTGNDSIGGKHWIGVNNKTKEYFDPLGLPMLKFIPKDYKNNNHHTIQNINFGHCGQYSTLWLYYSNLGKMDEFYKLFKEGYYH